MPAGFEGLNDLALDLRWTWSHFSDRLWERLDQEAWERTGNPYFILQSVPKVRLEEAARDEALKRDLQEWIRAGSGDDPGGIVCGRTRYAFPLPDSPSTKRTRFQIRQCVYLQRRGPGFTSRESLHSPHPAVSSACGGTVGMSGNLLDAVTASCTLSV